MSCFLSRARPFLAAALLLVALAALSGCAMVGPKSIRAGRLKYAEAINQTEDEQLLLSVVKGRYGETSSLLTVNGVAANLRFQASLGVEAGFPGAGDAGDDLAIGGIAYEENPTITYTPVQGDHYVRQLMSPIPLDLLVMAFRSGATNVHRIEILVDRINGLRNPCFLDQDGAEPEIGFVRFLELVRILKRVGVAEVLIDPGETAEFALLLGDYAPDHTGEVVELLRLLDLVPPGKLGDDLVIPIRLALVPRGSWAIGITTRSTFELLEILRASVEVPQEHAAAGIALAYPPVGLAGRGVVIHATKDKPAGTVNAIRYRDHWYFIREDDLASKAVFGILRSAWSLCIDQSLLDNKAPVLTLPVGG